MNTNKVKFGSFVPLCPSFLKTLKPAHNTEQPISQIFCNLLPVLHSFSTQCHRCLNCYDGFAVITFRFMIFIFSILSHWTKFHIYIFWFKVQALVGFEKTIKHLDDHLVEIGSKVILIYLKIVQFLWLDWKLVCFSNFLFFQFFVFWKEKLV